MEWPQLEELKQVLDVTSEDWDGDTDDTRLTRLLAAAVAKVKTDVGDWDEYVDVPDAALSQATLRMAELMAARPDGTSGFRLAASAPGAEQDPTYLRLMHGHRRSFGIA